MRFCSNGNLTCGERTGDLFVSVADNNSRYLRGTLRSNQTMKPTAPDRMHASMFATDPARGLSLSR